MPHLHNGVGTWYIGKKNLQRTEGKCEFCGYWGSLTSYETRLWLLVFFVPVIPLAKKQILDDCSRCRRHRSLPLAKWKEIEADGLRKAMQKADTNPDDPQAMLELHGTMVGFRRLKDAFELAKVLEARFSDQIDVQLHLGSWHASEGRVDQARPCFRQALELDPTNLNARNMVALECIESGDLPRARELLRGMDTPGPNQAPHSILALADAYQLQGDHAAALKFYRMALTMVPAFGQDKLLRKRIQQSEQALGVADSALPQVKWKPGKGLIAAVAAVAALLGAVAYNFYQSRNQPLFIVNGMNEPIDVRLDGGKPISVPAHNHPKIALAEGDHQAVVSRQGEPDEIIDFRVENGFFERFSDRSAFVLNPGGAGTILWWEESYYPKNKPEPKNLNQNYRVHFGERSFVFRDIDCPFVQPPPEIKMKQHEQVVTKSALRFMNESPLAILSIFPENTPPQELANFAEVHLKYHREDELLLRVYVSLRMAANQTDQCREFLAGGLAKRPIAIEWHRSYQQVCQMTGHEAEAKAEYRKMLAADPHDSAMLYLMGRTASDPNEQKRYFQQAMEADPQNAYPQYALAFDLAMQGDFAAAKPLAETACRIKSKHPDMESLLYEVRFALGEFTALETEIQQQWTASPLSLHTVGRLMQVQAAQGTLQRARETQTEFARKFAEDNANGPNPDSNQYVLQSRLMLLYLENDMQSILNECSALQQPQQAAGETFAAQIELDHPEAAEPLIYTEPAGRVSQTQAMLLSLAWGRKGDAAKAEQWRKKAIESLRAGDNEQKKAAVFLEVKNLKLDELGALPLPREFKSIWLVSLADGCAEHRQKLLEQAEKLNFDTYFPHRFLKRTIEEMKVK